MGSLRSTTNFLVREIFRPSITLRISTVPLQLKSHHRLLPRSISFSPVRCAAASDGDGKKSPSRLAQVKQLLHEATERAQAAGNEPIPKITLDHVTVNFARSGGPGGQNVNKVNTKVDMRFNVKNAYWLSERVREKILQMEKNRINKDGELVISSTKTRTQKGNVEDALSKLQVLTRDSSHFLSIGMVDLEGQMMLQCVGGCRSSMYWSIMNCSLSSILQDIIDAASHVPPPPSEEQVQRISKLAAIGERKRLDNKKAQSQKKAMRRSRDSWD